MIAWRLFYNPMQMADGTLWLLLPLCASVAIVYKTIRTESLRRLPREILELMGLMVAGLVTLGAVLWLIQRYLP